MQTPFDRRDFLKTSAVAALAGLTSSFAFADDKKPLFEISLAEWSLHRALKGGKLDNLDFPKVAKEEYGIHAVEFVNQFFMDKAKDEKYLAELKKRGADEGVKLLLIMCDGEGALGDPDKEKRKTAIENHYKWADAAKFLGCHSIRVNAQSSGIIEDQVELAADGLHRLTEYAAKLEINVIVENHGGLSSHGGWLTQVMKKVNHPRCGTLPDFGNFKITPTIEYDRYKGTTELMQFAKSVSAKSHDFDDAGNETKTDYMKMMKIVLAAGYHGYVGIEYEGGRLSEPDGIRLTKKLLERVRTELSKG